MSDAFQGDVLAEETHSGGAWSLLILPAMLGLVIALTVAQPAAVRWPAILACVIGLSTLAVTWRGFQYRFLHDGVESRVFGFGLRSTRGQSLVSDSIAPWTLIR